MVTTKAAIKAGERDSRKYTHGHWEYSFAQSLVVRFRYGVFADGYCELGRRIAIQSTQIRTHERDIHGEGN